MINVVKGIYKRGNIFWIRYAGLDGKVIFETSHSIKLRDAENLLHKRKADIQEGKQPQPIKKMARYTFRELANEYAKWAERQRSFYSKIYLINQLVETFGNLLLRHFNIMMLEHFQTQRLQKGNKPASINRYIATLKHMFTKACEWDMVEEEILKRVRKVKLLEENNKRLRYLSKEECQKLLTSCDPYLKSIVTLALNTGMRKGEILKLKWDSVDLRHGFILLDKTKNGERRELPINETLSMTLKSLQRRLDISYVFYNPVNGKPYRDIQRVFNKACKHAGIRDFHFHDLRHTFASHLVMSGIDITTVKELLGHKTLTMTLRYAHLAPSHKVKAVDVLDNVLNGRSTIQKLYNLEVIG